MSEQQAVGPTTGMSGQSARLAPHPGSPILSVVIINYNGARFLPELLESLKEQTFRNFHTRLVDNASSDGSLDLLRNEYPWVEVTALQSNEGFSRAGNRGVAAATAPWVLFLNPDIRLEPGCLEELLKVAGTDPAIAAVACKMRLYSQPERLNGVGGAMNYLGYTWDRGMFEKDRGQYDRCDEVLFASAGAGLFRRSAFLDSGGFDETFFMYHEDVDLCWRLWLLGHRVVTAPGAVVYHHFSASTRQSRGMQWREALGERHNMRALLKNYEWKNLFRAGLGLLRLRQPPRRKLVQLRNFAWNLVRLLGTLRERRRIQRLRRRQDRELEPLIVQSERVPIRL